MAVAIGALGGCGGDGVEGPPDGATAPDGQPDATELCPTAMHFPVVVPKRTEAYWVGGSSENPTAIAGAGEFVGENENLLLQIELYKGTGVFSNGNIRTGTFEVEGDALNYATCGVCTLLYAGGPDDAQAYFVTAGSITIESISPQFSASGTRLTLVPVTIDSNNYTSTIVPGGCPVTIDDVELRADLHPYQGVGPTSLRR